MSTIVSLANLIHSVRFLDATTAARTMSLIVVT
jgi:hypothetical protein